ncbi:hypothetical protein M422DRAFT_97226, partial [Sphaerobolus stellatus SS14]
YHAALSHIEQLVSQRIMELTKLNISGTGYKLRTQIAAGLKRQAIRNALVRYNKFAALVNPPRDPLTWETVVNYSFLAEFDLLRFSQVDIRDRPWVKPVIREGVMSYCKLQCARAEIKRLNVEIPRLYAAIHDEAQQIPAYISILEQTDRALANEVSRW